MNLYIDEHFLAFLKISSHINAVIAHVSNTADRRTQTQKQLTKTTTAARQHMRFVFGKVPEDYDLRMAAAM